MSTHQNYGSGYFDDSVHGRQFTLDMGLAGVFGLMFSALLVSAVAAWLTLSFAPLFDLVHTSPAGAFIFMLLPIGFVWIVFPRVWRMPPAAAVFSLFAFAFIMGAALSYIFLVYHLGTIMLAFVSAAGMFGVMAIFGAVTKSDLTKMRSILLMGIVGAIIATVVNVFFFASSQLDMIISYLFLALFLGLTAYHVQNIKRQMELGMGRAPIAIMASGALCLYLNFINTFLILLRLMNRRR